MRSLNAITWLKWLKHHTGIRSRWLIPGTSTCVSVNFHETIDYHLELLLSSDPLNLAPCLGTQCWCHGLKTLSGEVVLLLPRILRYTTDEESAHASFSFGSSGFAVKLKLHDERSQDSLGCLVTLQPLEVQSGSFESINEVDGFSPVWSDGICDTLRTAYSTEALQLTNQAASGINSDSVNFSSIVAIMSLLDQLWGPSDTVTSNELLCCTHEALHKNPHLSRLLPRCIFIKLTPSCLKWFLEDGIFLDSAGPAVRFRTLSSSTASSFLSTSSSQESSSRCCDADHPPSGNDESCELDATSSSLANVSHYEETDEFKDLCHRIDSTLSRLGGNGVPKFLWSAPKDAIWVTPDESLICTSARDVLLLMKSSTWIVHDLESALHRAVDTVIDSKRPLVPITERSDITLGLNTVVAIHDGLEFRVFFWSDRILGISQRDLEFAYPALTERRREDLIGAIQAFFHTCFVPASLPLHRGALDVYFVDTRDKKNTPQQSSLDCRLLSVSPWGSLTDPLLFSYDELREKALSCRENNLTSNSLDFRVIGPNHRRRCNPESVQRIPKDIRDLHLKNSTVESIVDVLRQEQRSSTN